jgi:predicted amidohydrolase YtcJ
VQRLHQRLAALLPNCPPLIGWAAADLRLDPVELADPAQRLKSDARRDDGRVAMGYWQRPRSKQPPSVATLAGLDQIEWEPLVLMRRDASLVPLALEPGALRVV